MKKKEVLRNMKKILNFLPDRVYIQLYYFMKFKKFVNMDNPKTLNEKLQWLKLNDRKDIYTTIVDKYLVRDYIADTIGEEYLIPLIGVWDSPDEIDFESLPNKFAMKCNHNSAFGMCICEDKSKLDINKVKQELQKGLAEDFYLIGREWPYKNVPRKIICEGFLTDGEPGGLTDYKFFCFNGEVDSVMVCKDRNTGNPKFYFFDKNLEFKKYDTNSKELPHDFQFENKEKLKEMFKLAAKLSTGFPYLRVDLYLVEDKIYFGELTLYPGGGFDNDIEQNIDEYWGSLIELPISTQE